MMTLQFGELVLPGFIIPETFGPYSLSDKCFLCHELMKPVDSASADAGAVGRAFMVTSQQHVLGLVLNSLTG